jgi:hypothetical protein
MSYVGIFFWFLGYQLTTYVTHAVIVLLTPINLESFDTYLFMKIADYITEIERAYQGLLQDADLATGRHEYAFDYTPRRPSHIRPRNRPHPSPPQLVPSFDNTLTAIPFRNKELLVKLAAFEASYQDTVTPLTPDMVPIIIDSGASISISPYATDFLGPIRPVQHVTLKGIASGLKVAGIGTIKYSFYNDAKELQSIRLQHYLHVPQCSVRLLCPQQIGKSTGHRPRQTHYHLL